MIYDCSECGRRFDAMKARDPYSSLCPSCGERAKKWDDKTVERRQKKIEGRTRDCGHCGGSGSENDGHGTPCFQCNGKGHRPMTFSDLDKEGLD